LVAKAASALVVVVEAVAAVVVVVVAADNEVRSQTNEKGGFSLHQSGGEVACF
jgi:hypothetical protein